MNVQNRTSRVMIYLALTISTSMALLLGVLFMLMWTLVFTTECI